MPTHSPGSAEGAGARATRARRRRGRLRRAGAAEATRIEILKSAACAFRRLGYHGATVEQIASALKMKKGNLYYYFRNKEDILFACHEYSLDRMLMVLDEIERNSLPPDRKLRQLLVTAVHIILDELHGTALYLELEALTPAHLKVIVARRDQFDQGVRRLLGEGIRAGRFAPQADAKLVSFAMLGAVNWIPRWYNPDGASTSQHIADTFADYLLQGLRPL